MFFDDTSRTAFFCDAAETTAILCVYVSFAPLALCRVASRTQGLRPGL